MSQNELSEIYNRVVVQATSPSGEPLRVVRTQGEQPGAPLMPIASPAPTNPSFDTDTTGWTLGGDPSTFVRTTTAGQFQSAPAAGKWTVPGATVPTLTGTFTGTFQAGVTYALTVWLKSSGGGLNIASYFGVPGDERYQNVIASGAADGLVNTVFWTPSATVTSGVRLRLLVSSSANDIFIDTLTLFKAVPTFVDRRGFRRTKRLHVTAALASDGVAAAQIADAYLSTHKLAQFKGDYVITGPVREILTGRTVPPDELLARTGELMLFHDRIDPDTGATGRVGRIVQVTYDYEQDQATVAIDTTSSNFEALLQRLGAISGGR